MPRESFKIAVIELNPRHDEIFPAWLHLAESNGYSVDFFVAPVHESRDIFAVHRSPRPNCYLTSSPKLGNAAVFRLLERIYTKWLRLRTLLRVVTRYDLVIANSVEPVNSFWLLFPFLHKPTLTVIHNANLLVTDKRYERLNNKKTNAFIVLSKHVQDFLRRRGVASYAINSFLGLNSEVLRHSNPDQAIFCVQGNTDFHRRNYDSLLNAAAKLKQQGKRCKFRIVGRINESARVLQERIDQSALSEYFEFVGDAESYLDYYKAIRGAQFLLFLVDNSKKDYEPFFQDKCTSSLGVALGLDVIPIVNRKLADGYDITRCSVLYDSDDVCSGIKSAMELDRGEIVELANRLRDTKKQFIDESELEFQKAQDSVTP